MSDCHSADKTQGSRKCCCELQQWCAGTAPHFAAPQSFLFCLGFASFSFFFQLQRSFGVSERFFFLLTHIIILFLFLQLQDKDTC